MSKNKNSYKSLVIGIILILIVGLSFLFYRSKFGSKLYDRRENLPTEPKTELANNIKVDAITK